MYYVNLVEYDYTFRRMSFESYQCALAYADHEFEAGAWASIYVTDSQGKELYDPMRKRYHDVFYRGVTV